MKYRVRTGENRWKWVWMGVDGCVGARGARETQKQGKRGAFRVLQTRIGDLWSRKFPRTWCFFGFAKMLKIVCIWIQIGSDGFNRVCGHGEQQKQGKKSAKWASRICFMMYFKVKKYNILTDMVEVIIECKGEGWQESEGCTGNLY